MDRKAHLSSRSLSDNSSVEENIELVVNEKVMKSNIGSQNLKFYGTKKELIYEKCYKKN